MHQVSLLRSIGAIELKYKIKTCQQRLYQLLNEKLSLEVDPNIIINRVSQPVKADFIKILSLLGRFSSPILHLDLQMNLPLSGRRSFMYIFAILVSELFTSMITVVATVYFAHFLGVALPAMMLLRLLAYDHRQPP